MTILVTGAAGFIGAHLVRRLLGQGETVVGIDDLNAYYNPGLKHQRLGWVEHPRFTFHTFDVADAPTLAALCAQATPTVVIHLAAQAGVRYSLDNPFSYDRTNVGGQLSVLEAVRHMPAPPALIYASSSSVYGERPLDLARGFREEDPTDAPTSLYAATKRSGELIASAYTRLFGLRATGLRFFTVYGPWGRPDMAYYSFTEKILAGRPIEVFGEGRMARDFTYVDDIIDGILGVMEHPGDSGAHRMFNIGDSQPRGLMELIEILERHLGRSARTIMRPMQAGDVSATFADISKLTALTGYRPKVSLEEGLERFVAWRLARA